jgi:hypothetical protein
MRLRKREPLQAEKMPHLRGSRNLRQEVDNFRSLHTEARQKVAGLFSPSIPTCRWCRRGNPLYLNQENAASRDAATNATINQETLQVCHLSK